MLFELCISVVISIVSIHSPTIYPTGVQAKTAQGSNFFLFEYTASLTPEDYHLLLDSIRTQSSADYLTLRMAYTKTGEYFRYTARIDDMHSRLSSAIYRDDFDDAILISDSILAFAFVDITAHMYNAYTYDRLGEPDRSQYHEAMYNGLLESILATGDGNSAETAYIIISRQEELAFLRWYNLHIIEQSEARIDGFVFDRLKTMDMKADEEYDIYFNRTLVLETTERSSGK